MSSNHPWWLDMDEKPDDAMSTNESVYLDDEETASPPKPKQPSTPPPPKQPKRKLSHKRTSSTTPSQSPSEASGSPQRKSSSTQRSSRDERESPQPKPSSRRSSNDRTRPQRPKSNSSNVQRSEPEAIRTEPKPSSGSIRSNGVYSETISSSETRSSGGRSDTAHSNNSASSSSGARHYTVAELISSLGEQDVELPPALERRVRDFKFAQSKRRERHGDNKPWGIFGLYAHLSDIRADLEWAEDAAWRRQRGEPYLSWSDFEKPREVVGIHNRPLFTYCIIGLCTIMLIVSFGVNDWKIEPLSVNPLFGPSSETLVKCGARQTNLIVNEGEWYRLFSPLILHAGLIHYIMNMLAMWYIGAAVEQSHGFASAAVLFIIPAVGGNILSAICLPQYITVGASGGIFGLIGGCVADIALNWNLLFLKTTTDENTRWRHFMVLFWLASDVFINCLIGFTPFVDNFTHLGGFMYGLCCGLSTIEQLAVGFFGLSNGNCSKLKNTFVKFFGLIVSVVTIMVTTVLLVQSDGFTSPCHGCRYISCVPFPFSAEDKWWYCDDCDSVTADLFVAANGSGLYEQIELKCPDGSVEEIVITQDGLTDKEKVRRELPYYCRAHCEGVFVSN